MKLRIFQTYDMDGVNSSKELQFWDAEFCRWEPVPFIRCPETDEAFAMRTEDYYEEYKG